MLLVFHRHGIEHLGSVNLVCLKHLREQGNPFSTLKAQAQLGPKKNWTRSTSTGSPVCAV